MEFLKGQLAGVLVEGSTQTVLAIILRIVGGPGREEEAAFLETPAPWAYNHRLLRCSLLPTPSPNRAQISLTQASFGPSSGMGG